MLDTLEKKFVFHIIKSLLQKITIMIKYARYFFDNFFINHELLVSGVESLKELKTLLFVVFSIFKLIVRWYLPLNSWKRFKQWGSANIQTSSLFIKRSWWRQKFGWWWSCLPTVCYFYFVQYKVFMFKKINIWFNFLIH